jgi:hypothetical protein
MDFKITNYNVWLLSGIGAAGNDKLDIKTTFETNGINHEIIIPADDMLYRKAKLELETEIGRVIARELLRDKEVKERTEEVLEYLK